MYLFVHLSFNQKAGNLVKINTTCKYMYLVNVGFKPKNVLHYFPRYFTVKKKLTEKRKHINLGFTKTHFTDIKLRFHILHVVYNRIYSI